MPVTDQERAAALEAFNSITDINPVNWRAVNAECAKFVETHYATIRAILTEPRPETVTVEEIAERLGVFPYYKEDFCETMSNVGDKFPNGLKIKFAEE
jgi:hypothetical protein